jgi:hypothetical protein
MQPLCEPLTLLASWVVSLSHLDRKLNFFLRNEKINFNEKKKSTPIGVNVPCLFLGPSQAKELLEVTDPE